MKEYSILIMYSEELKRDVKIYISLPKNYFITDKLYPVLYAHDGQILFNDYDGYKGESWGIMKRFFNNESSPEIILVGINSCQTRDDELLPVFVDYNHSGHFFGGKADDYLGFIINTLIPIINKKYRTIKSPDHTGMLGISLGGVCSTYAATKYLNYFKLFGCLSTAFVPVQKDMLKIIDEADLSNIKKMYLDVGTNESDNKKNSDAYVVTNTEIYNILKEKLGSQKIRFEIIKDGQHIEKDWEKRFPEVISYLFDQ